MTDTQCPTHPRQPAVACQECFDELLEARDAAGLRMWGAARLAADCDDRFPRRFAAAAVDHPDVKDWVETWRADPEAAPSLLLAGAVGVGKTWQAYAALREAATTVRQHPRFINRVPGPSWEAVTSADLYASLRPRTGVDTEAVMETYRRVDMLLVDDLGAAKNSEFVEETTYRILSGRYDDMRPSIFTTNLPPAELKHALGDRIASRLAESCRLVVLDGPDRRRAK
ncbi:ATP-binding protein [Glycomyces arizonensis]|uniref:ATP-binding protein n=1 Tax=Glycomyces arizonensis TaxID=256035 RepID=UPI0003F59562|nr:ATP-binding protein [Glycomyces arizonensis]